MIIIGFSGTKGAGKSFASSIAYRALILNGYQSHVTSFAEPLKRMLTSGLSIPRASIYGTQEQKQQIIPALGVSGRHLMQTLGTDWGRNMITPDLWIQQAQATIDSRRHAAPHPHTAVIFEDVRFDDEAELIRDNGGAIIHLLREGDHEPDSHASEAGVTPHSQDGLLHNDGSALFTGHVVRCVEHLVQTAKTGLAA